MKRNLAVALILCACMFTANKSYAATSNVETYTVTVPSATSIVMKAGANFGVITQGEVAAVVNDNAAHVLVVGAGDASDSYVATTDVATATAAQYTITFGASGGSTIDALNDTAGKAVLVVSNGAATSTVSIIITDDTGAAYPKLGSPTAGGIAFVKSLLTLNIPAASTVPFSSGKAALNMKMDLDEGSVTTADVAGDVAYTVTLTGVGL